jgi:hypothetical protein
MIPRIPAPNNPDAPNPATTPRFYSGHLRRRVGDPGRGKDPNREWTRMNANRFYCFCRRCLQEMAQP